MIVGTRSGPLDDPRPAVASSGVRRVFDRRLKTYGYITFGWGRCVITAEMIAPAWMHQQLTAEQYD